MEKPATKSNKFIEKYVPLLKFNHGYKEVPLISTTQKAIRIRAKKEGLSQILQIQDNKYFR